MSLDKLLSFSNTSLLFIAPPAWGKTRLLLELMKKIDKSFVFLSPLRALSEEFYITASKHKRTLRFEEIEGKLMKNTFYIGTVEKWLGANAYFEEEDTIFIFDEFHLFYYWGESFRFLLRDCYEEVASTNSSCLFLTATMNETYFFKWREESRLNFSNTFTINLGNQILKNLPARKFYYPRLFKDLMNKQIKKQVKQNRGTCLILVKYREEVNWWGEYLQREGVCFLSCKGGQAREFSQALVINPNVRVIVATSVLSHGVNLPAIENIFINYKVGNRDFWIQNVGRAGRRGESFTLHTMDKEGFRPFELLLSALFIIFKSLCYKLKSIYE